MKKSEIEELKSEIKKLREEIDQLKLAQLAGGTHHHYHTHQPPVFIPATQPALPSFPYITCQAKFQ